MKLRLSTLSAACVVGILTASSTCAASPLDFHSFSEDTDRATADVLQIANPLAALGISLYKHDTDGAWQLGYTVGATLLATQAIKYSFNHTAWGERPDGGDYSFPSGHTAGACTGAAYLTDRYGWEYGLPFYLTSAFVGYNRIVEHRHWTRDVIAGCVVAIGASKLLTTRYGSTRASVTPLPLSDAGFGLSMKLDF